MTKERQDLIDRFQKWFDTKPREQIIAAQCATIAEEYAEQLLIHNDVKMFGCGWDFCDAVLDKKGGVRCGKCNRYE